MKAVLSAKIQGISVLSQLFKQTPLDFMVCASSLTAIVGGVGQLDYCVGNLFLDYFLAQHPFEKCNRLLTLNWNSWSSIGMATNVKSSKTHEALYLENSVTPEEAMTLLETAFESSCEQVIISHFSPDIERKRMIDAFNHPSSQVEEHHCNPTAQSTFDAIKQIWQDPLGVKTINNDDTFYSLGGDSLLAIQLLMALDHRFGIDMSLQELAHAHTLISLEKIIETRPVRSPGMIVPLANQSASKKMNKPAVYFIHPLGGTVLCYFPLTTYLTDSALYAIQDPELAQGKHVFDSISQMAECYANKIQEAQEKNIILVGFSFGGNVAVEMVSPLNRLGITVQKMILIDSWATLGGITVLNENKVELIEDLDSLKTIKDHYGVESHQYQSIIKRLLWLRSYLPSTVNLDIHLLAAKDLLPLYAKIAVENNGWTPYCSKPILKYTMEGNHQTMLQSTYLPVIGKKLKELINA